MKNPRSSEKVVGSMRRAPGSEVFKTFKTRGMIQHTLGIVFSMRPHLVLASNVAVRQTPDALRVMVVSSAPLVRAGLMTLLGGYHDLDLTEGEPARGVVGGADVLLCDEPQPAAGVPALVLVRDASAAAEALAG